MKSHAGLIAAIWNADAEVKVVEAEPLMPLDETRVLRLGLAEQNRRFAVTEAVLRGPTPFPWNEVADALQLSIDEAKNKFIR